MTSSSSKARNWFPICEIGVSSCGKRIEIKRDVADLVCYAPPIVLVWLPRDINVRPLENVGWRLTLLAANFYGFRTRVRTAGTVEEWDTRAPRPSCVRQKHPLAVGEEGPGRGWKWGENKLTIGDAGRGNCLTGRTQLSTVPRVVVWLRRALSERRSESRLSQKRGRGCQHPFGR